MKPIKSRNILLMFASRTWGGGEQYVFDLGISLLKQGDNVFFISEKSDIIKKKMDTISQPLYMARRFSHFTLQTIIRITQFVRRNNIRIIHAHKFNHAFVAVFVKLLLPKQKIKVILTRHLVRKAKTNWLYTWLYKCLDKLIFVSELAKQTFLSTHPTIDNAKIEVLHNSSLINNNSSYLKMDLRKQYQLSPDTVLLGFSGRLSPEKGLDVLVTAISLLPKNLPVHLFIAGAGKLEYEQMIRNKIHSLQLEYKITLLGFCDYIPSFISNTDIAVLPSIWQEPFGLSMIEFMREGKPVITTNHGAQNEYITHAVNGILIEPNNPEALANAIQKLCVEKDLCELFGKNAYNKFWNDMTYETFMNKINILYDEVLCFKQYKILIDLSKLSGSYCGLWEFSYQFATHLIQILANNRMWHVSFLAYRKNPLSHNKNINFIYVSWVQRLFLWMNKKYDIVHALYQNSPYIRMKNEKSIYITTIHDLNFLYEKKGTRLLFYKHKYQENIAGIDYIVFISKYAAIDASKYLYSLPPSSVIYEGVDINYDRIQQPHTVMQGIANTPFLFVVCTIMRKKNMHTLIPMMQFLPQYKLVIAGSIIHTDYYNEMKKMIHQYNLQNNIFIVGSITEEEKAYFYNYCTAFVFPSLAEGFGIPPIEAMSYGKPVFVSDKTSIPEVCGEMAFYWTQFDPQYMADVFKQGMDLYNAEPNYAQHLKNFVKEKYNWNKCIEQYLQLYTKLVEENGKQP